jgi:hypothetical protein
VLRPALLRASILAWRASVFTTFLVVSGVTGSTVSATCWTGGATFAASGTTAGTFFTGSAAAASAAHITVLARALPLEILAFLAFTAARVLSDTQGVQGEIFILQSRHTDTQGFNLLHPLDADFDADFDAGFDAILWS